MNCVVRRGRDRGAAGEEEEHAWLPWWVRGARVKAVEVVGLGLRG